MSPILDLVAAPITHVLAGLRLAAALLPAKGQCHVQRRPAWPPSPPFALSVSAFSEQNQGAGLTVSPAEVSLPERKHCLSDCAVSPGFVAGVSEHAEIADRASPWLESRTALKHVL